MTTPDLPAGLFSYDGFAYHPSEFTRGPWRRDAQHGGPPSGLLVHLCEPFVEEDEFLSHIEIELLRPVPLTALRPNVARRQVSGRVARIDAELHSSAVEDGSMDAELVARATALILKRTELTAPQSVEEPVPATEPPLVDKVLVPPRWASGDVTTYHRNAVEHRFTEGSFRTPGPVVDWVRLRMPLIAEAETTGLQLLAATADFGSGISAIYGPNTAVGLINANLTISVHRANVGDWVSLDSKTHLGEQGTGLCITTLGDVSGVVGVATQSLLGYSIQR
ncbi:MAG: hypothetical protein ACI81L_003119 [Verrucomicrobiales bacterium]|jgi:hypothetical protein